MKRLACLLLVLLSCSAGLAACPFDGLYINDLKQDPDFAVSAESPGKISRGLFWANQEFFRQFNRKECRGAYKSANVTHLASGEIFTYYRTVLDECDGGNTVGLIVSFGRNRAIAEIGDSEINCRQ